jgi:hypothetical protein
LRAQEKFPPIGGTRRLFDLFVSLFIAFSYMPMASANYSPKISRSLVFSQKFWREFRA